MPSYGIISLLTVWEPDLTAILFSIGAILFVLIFDIISIALGALLTASVIAIWFSFFLGGTFFLILNFSACSRSGLLGLLISFTNFWSIFSSSDGVQMNPSLVCDTSKPWNSKSPNNRWYVYELGALNILCIY